MNSKSILTTALLLFACITQAVQMVPLSIQQLTDRANLILHGRVAAATVQRDPQGRIYTRIELNVTEVWKGDSALKSFVIVQAGGVLGDEAVTVDGQEKFAIGEEVVLFLVLNARGEGVVVGLAQGKFKVTTDARGEKSAHNRFHGSPPTIAPNVRGPTGDVRKPLPLAILKKQVQGGRP
jgi:hypothetical protein